MMNFIYITAISLLFACSKKNVPADIVTATGSNIVNVQTATELQHALANAKAGDEIVMADGTYNGKFVIAPNTNGTAAKPIILRGSRNAILNAGDIDKIHHCHKL